MKKNHLKKVKWNLRGRRRGLLFAMLGIISFSFFGLLSGLFADIGSADTKVPDLKPSYVMDGVTYYDTGTDGSGALDRDLYRNALIANNKNAQSNTKVISPLESWQNLAFVLACGKIPDSFDLEVTKNYCLSSFDTLSWMLMNRGYFGDVTSINSSSTKITKTLEGEGDVALPDCVVRPYSHYKYSGTIFPLSFYSSLENAEASVLSEMKDASYGLHVPKYIDEGDIAGLTDGGSNVFAFHTFAQSDDLHYNDLAIYFSNFQVQPVLFDELGNKDNAGTQFLLEKKIGDDAIEWPSDLSKSSYNVEYHINDTDAVNPSEDLNTTRKGVITNTISTKDGLSESTKTTWKVGGSYEMGVKDVWKIAFNGEYSKEMNNAISSEISKGETTTQEVTTGVETHMSMPARTAFCLEYGEDTASVTRTFHQPVRITYDVDIVEYTNCVDYIGAIVGVKEARKIAHFSSNASYRYENALDSAKKRWESHAESSGRDEEGCLWSDDQKVMQGNYSGGPSNIGFNDFKTLLTQQYPFIANGTTTITASRDVYVSQFAQQMPTAELLDMNVSNMPTTLEFEPNTKAALDLDSIEVEFIRSCDDVSYSTDVLRGHGEWVLETRNIDGSYEPAYGNTIASISKTILGRDVLDIGSTKGTIYLTFYPYESDKGYPYWNVNSKCQCYSTRDTLKHTATIEINVK